MADASDDDDVVVHVGVVGTMETVMSTYGYPAIRLAIALGVVWFASGASS